MSNHTTTQVNEAADGYRWFFGVGILAVLFSIFLATVDQRLSESDKERRLGDTLRELRSAQTTLPSRSTDRRQHTSYLNSGANSGNGAAHHEGH